MLAEFEHIWAARKRSSERSSMVLPCLLLPPAPGICPGCLPVAVRLLYLAALHCLSPHCLPGSPARHWLWSHHLSLDHWLPSVAGVAHPASPSRSGVAHSSSLVCSRAAFCGSRPPSLSRLASACDFPWTGVHMAVCLLVWC